VYEGLQHGSVVDEKLSELFNSHVRFSLFVEVLLNYLCDRFVRTCLLGNSFTQNLDFLPRLQ